MVRIVALFALLLALLPAPTAAADGTSFRLGDDAYLTGARARHVAAGIVDLFAAGETVTLAAPIAGSAHLAARRVNLSASVGHNVYAAGMDVALDAPVAGNATLAGYSLDMRGAVEGNLRASGANLALDAPVGGTALLTGDRVRVSAPIAGDVVITARDLSFGAGARIDGSLQIFAEDPDAFSVPSSVIDEARITRHRVESWQGPASVAPVMPGWRSAMRGFLFGIVTIALGVAMIAALIAAIAPGPLANMRQRLTARPFATLGWGFVFLSALIGSAVVIGLTLIGLLFAPAMFVLVLVAGFAGYVVGAYCLGASILRLFRAWPTRPAASALAAFVGVAAAVLIGLVPFLGWLFVLALMLAGLGALIGNLLRPSFFAA